MKKIYKYPTGAEIPEGAIYLSTVTQTHEGRMTKMAVGKDREVYFPCWYVWHYFLVEVEPP